VIIHCAAKVGDWGPVAAYRQINVEGLRNLLEAVKDKPLHRFVHLSTLGVYAACNHFGTDETCALPRKHIDGYTQSKVEAETLAVGYHRDYGVPVTILRPGFVYGPRDRTVLPKLLAAMKSGEVKYLGSGQQAMNTIGVHNLVDAIYLAVQCDAAVGKMYNLTDVEPVSKRRFLETIAKYAGLEPPDSSVPLWVAKILAKVMEGSARAIGAKHPPLLTQARIKFLGLHLGFSVAKAKRELGYRPRVPFAEGMKEAVAWAMEQRESVPDEKPVEVR
jgi:nucleoside-diphosphate-sugar epimerase